MLLHMLNQHSVYTSLNAALFTYYPWLIKKSGNNLLRRANRYIHNTSVNDNILFTSVAV